MASRNQRVEEASGLNIRKRAAALQIAQQLIAAVNDKISALKTAGCFLHRLSECTAPCSRKQRTARSLFVLCANTLLRTKSQSILRCVTHCVIHSKSRFVPGSACETGRQLPQVTLLLTSFSCSYIKVTHVCERQMSSHHVHKRSSWLAFHPSVTFL